MPCIPLIDRAGKQPKRVGFLCVGNEPVCIQHNARKYYFEWTGGCGWMPCTKDGDERLSPVPKVVWDALGREPRKDKS